MKHVRNGRREQGSHEVEFVIPNGFRLRCSDLHAITDPGARMQQRAGNMTCTHAFVSRRGQAGAAKRPPRQAAAWQRATGQQCTWIEGECTSFSCRRGLRRSSPGRKAKARQGASAPSINPHALGALDSLGCLQVLEVLPHCLGLLPLVLNGNPRGLCGGCCCRGCFRRGRCRTLGGRRRPCHRLLQQRVARRLHCCQPPPAGPLREERGEWVV